MEEIMEAYPRVCAQINLDAIRENIRSMKRNLPEKTKIIAVVKADGYGHGAVPAAKAMDDAADAYATATAEEAVILRRHGIVRPVLVLGPVHPSRYGLLIAYDIRPVLSTRRELAAFNAQAEAVGKCAAVHLAVDTGMSRIGMAPNEQSADMVKEAAAYPGIFLEGIFTHFATADEADKEKTQRQLSRFRQFIALLEQRGVTIPMKHCANSAGIIEGIGTDFPWVRAGISLYGMYPSDEVAKERVPLVPALELKSYITFVKTIEPGDEVSYGGTYRAPSQRRIATIPVGYGDGYPRNLSGKGQVLIRGKRAPILGRVCMDQFMADVTEIEGVQEGDTVTLIGRDGKERISVEELAAACGGFHYEIVCNLGKRIPRIYLSQGKVVGSKDYAMDDYADFAAGTALRD